MRRVFWGVALLLGTSIALAQDQPNSDQLRRMYDDARNQLKQAQDRKNQLAAENDKLNAKLVDLQKQLDADKTKLDTAGRDEARFAEKTFFLRSHYAAWQDFISRQPKLEAQWRFFLEGAAPSQRLSDQLDADWPWSPAG